ncbi:MAG TPA: Holliday junction branch migration protein RuvA [Opitutales bacterium]|jgi:Holliday junction DNA helicase RuvA|nr:Holliday junction branch migration protein RuvA [Opitutales bacterium]
MIVSIEGLLVECTPLRAVVEAYGVGYEVNIPITTAERLPAVGQKVKLHTVAVYREDAQQLYGFAVREDRDFFHLLVEKVSGIGPKTALNLLSRLSADTLKSAIAQSNVDLLSKCPGIGKKTAERLVIELRDKVLDGAAAVLPADVSVNAAKDGGVFTDAVGALMALGYKAPDADKAARRAQSVLGPNATSEALVKKALAQA